MTIKKYRVKIKISIKKDADKKRIPIKKDSDKQTHVDKNKW